MDGLSTDCGRHWQQKESNDICTDNRKLCMHLQCISQTTNPSSKSPKFPSTPQSPQATPHEDNKDYPLPRYSQLLGGGGGQPLLPSTTERQTTLKNILRTCRLEMTTTAAVTVTTTQAVSEPRHAKDYMVPKTNCVGSEVDHHKQYSVATKNPGQTGENVIGRANKID